MISPRKPRRPLNRQLTMWSQKSPAFAFEKFPGSDPVLTTQMKSVGEAMAIGRTFQRILSKSPAFAGNRPAGWGCDKAEKLPSGEQIRAQLRTPNPDCIFAVRHALQRDES